MKTREVKIEDCKSHGEVKILLCHFLVWVTSALEPVLLSISWVFSNSSMGISILVS